MVTWWVYYEHWHEKLFWWLKLEASFENLRYLENTIMPLNRSIVKCKELHETESILDRLMKILIENLNYQLKCLQYTIAYVLEWNSLKYWFCLLLLSLGLNTCILGSSPKWFKWETCGRSYKTSLKRS